MCIFIRLQKYLQRLPLQRFHDVSWTCLNQLQGENTFSQARQAHFLIFLPMHLCSQSISRRPEDIRRWGTTRTLSCNLHAWKNISLLYLSFLLSPWKRFLFLDHYYIYYFVSHSKLVKNCVTLIWPRVTPLVGVASSGDSATDDLSANWSTEFDSLQTQKVHLQRQVSAHILLHLLVNMTHCRSRKCANLPAQQLIAVIGAGGKSICFAMSQGSAFASRYEFLTRTQSQLFRRNWVLTCFNLVPNSSPPCATKGVCLRQGSYKWKGFGVCVLLTWMTLQVLPVTCLMHDHDCITVYFACVLKGPLCACHENGEWSCCQDQKRHDTEFRQSWAPAMQNIKNASKSDRVCFPNNNLHSFASSAKLEHVSVVQRIAFCESQSSLHSASPWTGGLDDFNFGSSKWIQMQMQVICKRFRGQFSSFLVPGRELNVNPPVWSLPRAGRRNDHKHLQCSQFVLCLRYLAF